MPEDQTISCVQCHQPFVYSISQQQFYREHDFKTPKRCKTCRQANKEKKE